MILAGDIGGTKTIVQLVAVRPAEAPAVQAVLYEETFASRDFPDLVPQSRSATTFDTYRITAIKLY